MPNSLALLLLLLPSTSDHSTHTYAALVHPAATPTHTPGLVRGWQYYTSGQRRFTFLGSQTGTTTRRWTFRGPHASPAETPVRFLLLLSGYLYYFIKFYVYGPCRLRSPLGKAAVATAVCRALDACACARAHPPSPCSCIVLLQRCACGGAIIESVDGRTTSETPLPRRW